MRCTKRLAPIFVVLGFTAAAWAGETPPKPLVTNKPVKVVAADAAGPIFQSKSAVKSETGPDGSTTDVVMLRSKDQKVEMGLYEAGASEQDIQSYDDDEFMFFLSGGVTLTSSDGTVLIAKAGEGVAIPHGWKGHWSTKGYKKYYVTYSSEAAQK
jgi:uncharacterized cupin superfamily protein